MVEGVVVAVVGDADPVLGKEVGRDGGGLLAGRKRVDLWIGFADRGGV